MMLKVIVLVSLVQLTLQEIVITAQGRIRGETGEGYVSYRGIPYASVNNHSERFKMAGLAPTWSEVRQSQQTRCSTTSQIGECLQLEVHVPSSGDASVAWPVLVWVKGGSGAYSPGKLVQQGIIIVMVSHRIGPPGFLCMAEEAIPGNAGVKDVVLALRWVRDNIGAFKGNPHKVVVAGQGFGAAIVEALTLSEMARDLFHGAILQSGSVLCPWSFNYDAKERGLSLQNILVEDEGSTSDATRVDVHDLEAKAKKIDFPYYPFAMCVEKQFKYQERLLSDPPDKIMTENTPRNIPMIIGYNSNEAFVFVRSIKQNQVLKKMRRNLSFLLPDELGFANDIEVKQMAKQIQDLYFLNNLTIAALLTYHRDAYFLSHIYRSVRYHARSHQPLYFYRFSHSSERGVGSVLGVRKTGAAHSDELAYIFPERLSDLNGDDGVVQNHLLRMWSNFVKYLDPSPRKHAYTNWEPLEQRDPRLLDISTELTMKGFPHQRACEAWDDIYQRFYYAKNSL